MMYSQYEEEEHILNSFGQESGILLDIGAGLPTKGSNSRALIERGWQGMLVEPSPFMFCELVREYGFNGQNKQDIVLVNSAVHASEKDSLEVFHLNGEFTSSLIEEETRHWGCPYDKVFIHPISAKILTKTFQGHFTKCDFLSLDIEGCGVDLIPDLQPLNYQVACIEHGRKDDLTRIYQMHPGWKTIYINGTNILLQRP